MDADRDAAIQSGPISDAARELIETELAAQDNTTGYESALKTERAYSIAMIRSDAAGPANIARYMPRFLLNEGCTLDLYDTVIPTAAKPRYQVSKELDALDAELARTHVYSSRAVAQMLIPALQAAPGATGCASAALSKTLNPRCHWLCQY